MWSQSIALLDYCVIALQWVVENNITYGRPNGRPLYSTQLLTEATIMKNKLLPLIAGAALVVGVSAAQAAEPMQLANTQMDTVTAGNFPTFYENDQIQAQFNTTNQFTSTFTADPHYSGNTAAAGAKGDAENPYVFPIPCGCAGGGYTGVAVVPADSYTKADTLATATLGGGSTSFSSSAAAIKVAGTP